MYYLADTHFKQHDHKNVLTFQTERFFLDFDLCDFEIWIKVSVDIVKSKVPVVCQINDEKKLTLTHKSEKVCQNDMYLAN